MRTIGILLLVAALFGLWASTQAFGDIGIAFLYAAAIALLAGIATLTAAKPINAWKAADQQARIEALKQQSTKTDQESSEQ